MKRLRPLAERHPALAFALDVLDRIREVRASQLVNSIALRAFLSLFPLLVVTVAALGFLVAGDIPFSGTILKHLKLDKQSNITEQIIGRLKLEGGLADTFKENLKSAQDSRKASGVIGLVSLLLTGLGVVAAVAAALDAIWQVPARGARDKAMSLLWLLGVALLGAGLGVASGVTAWVPGVVGALVGLLIAVIAGAGIFWWTQWLLTNAPIPGRDLWPGAIVGGIGFAAFQTLGSYVLPRVIASASELYASIAVVIVLITVFSIFAWMLVLSAIVNVVAWEKTRGRVQMAIYAPALPAGAWAVVERGGQRPKLVKPRRAKRT